MLNICHDAMTRADCKDRSRNADWQPVCRFVDASIRPAVDNDNDNDETHGARPALSLSLPLCLSFSLSLRVDLQCKTTEMPRLKSLTKEINLGKLSSFCSSPVSGELHADLIPTRELATKNYAHFRSVSRSENAYTKMPWATFFPAQSFFSCAFFSFFLLLQSDFLLSAILLLVF